MIVPRQYQVDAHDAVIEHWKNSTMPVLVDAATGSGKSVIVAMIARTLNELSGGKRVLCLAPSKELTEQNADKYQAIGEKCSIYSASISKSLRHQVIFATPGTFKAVAKRLGHEFAGVIIDECHGTTQTIKAIIEDMKETSPNLRVAGLSATPFRLGTGFCYGIDVDGQALDESVCRDPYFYRCVFQIHARMLVDMGFLTPLHAGEINTGGYDTSGLTVQSNGQYSQKTVKAAFEGWGRKTASIVADIVAQTQNSTGVMIFAATVQHAQEVMASLHPDNSRMVTGETKKAEREKIIKDFKAQKFQILVNVSVLTTGFDAPNVDTVALLRQTESVSLLQQMMGRGMRLFDGKEHCLILDYAGNLEKHCPDGDLYAPEIRAAYKGEKQEPLPCVCEKCGGVNNFAPRQNDEGWQIDEYGYFCDVAGQRVMVQALNESKPMPASYGRRCQHYDLRSGERCSYYWSSKVCEVCDHHNDIAARFCSGCKAELVNPNDRLIEIHKQHKKDPTLRQCDEVLEIEYINGLSRSGNDMVTAHITTSRRKFTVYLLEHSQFLADKKLFFMQGTDNFTTTPKTIAYRKNKDFFEVMGFNQPTDDEVLSERLQNI